MLPCEAPKKVLSLRLLDGVRVVLGPALSAAAFVAEQHAHSHTHAVVQLVEGVTRPRPPALALLQARYPRNTPQQQQRRTARAVWRGSSTDPSHPLVEEGNALDLARTRLALLGRWYPNVLDAALVGWVQTAFQGQCVDEVMPLGESGRWVCGVLVLWRGAASPATCDCNHESDTGVCDMRPCLAGSRLALEDFNRYALLLDIDGNGWSDRYRLLAHMNTPVLKQASNLTGEDPAAQGVPVFGR